MNLRWIITILTLALVGCAGISPLARRQHAEQLATQAGWQKLIIQADTFALAAFVPVHADRARTLTVYIEGDGLAWLTPAQPSNDPTPRDPLGLQLAMRHPQGVAVYLGRPCQYVMPEDARNCRQWYWTAGRFAPEVIAASNLALGELKRRFAAERLVLVGYSGGGAVAALLAARRKDVARLITVAGNLDHRAWTQAHHIRALDGSLNPADAWRALLDLPQLHLVGENDKVVGRNVADAYAARFPPDQRPRIVVIPGFEHHCCWVEQWDSLWPR